MCRYQENLDLAKEQEPADNAQHESILRTIEHIVHAGSCRSPPCPQEGCHKMKKVIQHTKMCKRRENSNCPVCKQLIALLVYHAKQCERDICEVPFCLNIRQQLEEARANRE